MCADQPRRQATGSQERTLILIRWDVLADVVLVFKPRGVQRFQSQHYFWDIRLITRTQKYRFLMVGPVIGNDYRP